MIYSLKRDANNETDFGNNENYKHHTWFWNRDCYTIQFSNSDNQNLNRPIIL